MPSLIQSPHEGGGAWPGGVGGIPTGPFGGASLFGDGSYSSNIIQGGSVLQPVGGVITVTGAATVDISSETGAAVLMCKGLVVNGGVLSVSAKCKGLMIFASQQVQLINGGQITMSKLGKAGNFGALTPLSLLPAACLPFIHRGQLAQFVVAAKGALGVAGVGGGSWTTAQVGNNGLAAGAMQTGGGGSGANRVGASGTSGCGGPCCGGAGSGGADGGSTSAAGDYGGPGSSGSGYSDSQGGGGAGDPVGSGGGYNAGAVPGLGPGGGLLFLFARSLSVASGCIISADGAQGGGGYSPGGSAGGGLVCVATGVGLYSNLGTVRAAGGPAQGAYNASGTGGGGGAGSVNIFTT